VLTSRSPLSISSAAATWTKSGDSGGLSAFPAHQTGQIRVSTCNRYPNVHLSEDVMDRVIYAPNSEVNASVTAQWSLKLQVNRCIIVKLPELHGNQKIRSDFQRDIGITNANLSPR
jgi:hypothetical protein